MDESGQKILYKDECYLVQGAVFEVYKEIGSGFVESVYQLSRKRSERSRYTLPVAA